MWMGVSIVIVSVLFYGLSRSLSYIQHKRNPPEKDNSQQIQLLTSPDREYKRVESVIIYILSINLQQCKFIKHLFPFLISNQFFLNICLECSCMFKRRNRSYNWATIARHSPYNWRLVLGLFRNHHCLLQCPRLFLDGTRQTPRSNN